MSIHELLSEYGPLLVFLNVFATSIGVPVPSMPTLVAVSAAHASSVDHPDASIERLLAIILCAVLGGVLADAVWFEAGRRHGQRVLHFLCALTSSTNQCLTRSSSFLQRWGVRLLIVVRFLPGMGLISVPMCGAMTVRWRDFLLHDAIGIFLWASVGLTFGASFAAEIELAMLRFKHYGLTAALILTAVVLVYGIARHLHNSAVRHKSDPAA